jgi:solute carrier family 9B (sodium/hydrogen exchanger), member 1/2
MLLALVLILVFSIFLWQGAERLKLPGLLGILLLGIFAALFAHTWVPQGLTDSSALLRTIALLIILGRAGLGLTGAELKAVGRPAVLMSFMPCLLEAIFVAFTAIYLLGMPTAVAWVLGFVLAAVSPAVIVPEMLRLKAKHPQSKVPALILAAASVDDVVAIAFFTVCLGVLAGAGFSWLAIGLIPVSMLSAILAGAFFAWLFCSIAHHIHFRPARRTILFLCLGALLVLAGEWLPLASYLAVMSLGFFLKRYSSDLASGVALQLGELWIVAEVFLFFLIGYQIDFTVLSQDGLKIALVLLVGLLARSLGVWLSLLRTKFTRQEKNLAIVAFLPKATVQAALGGIPLSLGLPGGQEILVAAVLAITLTAPLGAWLIRRLESGLAKS